MSITNSVWSAFKGQGIMLFILLHLMKIEPNNKRLIFTIVFFVDQGMEVAIAKVKELWQCCVMYR